MKRRLLPMMMTLVLVCALPIWAAFVTSGDVTNPLVCTAGAAEPTLQRMIDQANAGATITLNSNTEIAATLQITKNLTLDLNGHVLKMTGKGSVLYVKKGWDPVTLIITDSRSDAPHEDTTLPAGGVITGGNADDKGGGILLDGGSTLKLTGGCITDCRAGLAGGGVASRGGATLYMSGTARIKNCTAAQWSDMSAMDYTGTMYADGGTVEGSVKIQGGILHSEGTGATVFMGDMNYNSAGGVQGYIIESGIFKGNVYNRGVIKGGDFYGTVTNGIGWNGSITGGTFYGPIVNEVGPGQVTGGTFAVRFDTDGGSEIEPTMVEHSGKVQPPSDPEKSGHTFTGWYLDNAPYDFATLVTGPLTLTAKWEKVPSSGGYYYYHPTTDTKTTDTKGSPKTADPGVAPYAALSLLSLTGLTCTAKKR